MTKSAPARLWIALAARICPAPGTWPAAPAGHKSEAREATPVVRWLPLPVEGASPEVTRCPAAAGGSAPVRDSQLGALFGQVACGDRVAFEAAYCRTAGQVPGVGVSHAASAARRSAAPPPRCSAACAPGQAGFGARGGLPWQRGQHGHCRAVSRVTRCRRIHPPVRGQGRRSAALPAGVSTAKAGPPVRRASSSTTRLTGSG
jgi:hypothetical protein